MPLTLMQINQDGSLTSAPSGSYFVSHVYPPQQGYSPIVAPPLGSWSSDNTYWLWYRDTIPTEAREARRLPDYPCRAPYRPPSDNPLTYPYTYITIVSGKGWEVWRVPTDVWYNTNLFAVVVDGRDPVTALPYDTVPAHMVLYADIAYKYIYSYPDPIYRGLALLVARIRFDEFDYEVVWGLHGFVSSPEEATISQSLGVALEGDPSTIYIEATKVMRIGLDDLASRGRLPDPSEGETVREITVFVPREWGWPLLPMRRGDPAAVGQILYWWREEIARYMPPFNGEIPYFTTHTLFEGSVMIIPAIPYSDISGGPPVTRRGMCGSVPAPLLSTTRYSPAKQLSIKFTLRGVELVYVGLEEQDTYIRTHTWGKWLLPSDLTFQEDYGSYTPLNRVGELMEKHVFPGYSDTISLEDPPSFLLGWHTCDATRIPTGTPILERGAFVVTRGNRLHYPSNTLQEPIHLPAEVSPYFVSGPIPPSALVFVGSNAAEVVPNHPLAQVRTNTIYHMFEPMSLPDCLPTQDQFEVEAFKSGGGRITDKFPVAIPIAARSELEEFVESFYQPPAMYQNGISLNDSYYICKIVPKFVGIDALLRGATTEVIDIKFDPLYRGWWAPTGGWFVTYRYKFTEPIPMEVYTWLPYLPSSVKLISNSPFTAFYDVLVVTLVDRGRLQDEVVVVDRRVIRKDVTLSDYGRGRELVPAWLFGYSWWYWGHGDWTLNISTYLLPLNTDAESVEELGG